LDWGKETLFKKTPYVKRVPGTISAIHGKSVSISEAWGREKREVEKPFQGRKFEKI